MSHAPTALVNDHDINSRQPRRGVIIPISQNVSLVYMSDKSSSLHRSGELSSMD